MTEGERIDQDLESEGENTAENVVVGRDFNQINETTQNVESGPTKFPIDDPKDQGSWVNFFDMLTSALPFAPDEMDSAFRISYYASWIVGISSFASLIRDSLPVAIAIPFDAVIFGIALVVGMISGRYFAVRDATDCPNCGTSFALETVGVFEYPELSDSKKRRGERTVVCEVCDYKDTERISWEPDDE